ncbi:MAG: Sua5/YciO/YrdC/YwlC family protein [Patescibacteria group bacterium]
MIYKKNTIALVRILKSGGVGVIPTDTIYGIVGSALNQKTVERIYKLRKRNLKKPMIILISDLQDLKKFSIDVLHPTSNILRTWPSKTSIVFDCPQAKFHYIHRGTKSLAFRLPTSARRSQKRRRQTFNLKAFLKQTGPLVAPSANLEGEPPSKTIKDAQKYFGDKVDFYIDAGKKVSKPSRLFKIVDGKIIELRK